MQGSQTIESLAFINAKLNTGTPTFSYNGVGSISGDISFEHYKNWPYQLNALREAVNGGDEKKIESLKDSMIKHVKTLVLTGALTPIQGGAAVDSMTNVIDLSKEYHDFVKRSFPKLIERLSNGEKIKEDTTKDLKKATEEFKKGFSS